MESRELLKGVTLHLIDAPKFKTNLISVFFNIPLKRETVTQAALLPSVLKRGCSKYPTLKEISKRLNDLYSASFSAGVRPKGDGEVLYFTAEYISDKYIPEKITHDIADFIHDFIFSPLTEKDGFVSSFVESEKVNLKNAILSLVNDKKEYAEVKCREAMFGKEGYGMFEAGYVEDLDDITPQSLYEFYKLVLATAKVDIFISGNIDDETINSVTTALTPSFSPRNAEYIMTSVAKSNSADIRKVTEAVDTVQSKLCMGLCCNVEPTSKEYYALMLASCIFGGSPFSKLFNNVREKMSLAYYAVAKTARFKSVMMISSGIQTENYERAYDEIMVQFDKMLHGEIDDNEIESAKKYLTNAMNSMNDSLRGMEDYYLSGAIMKSNETVESLLDGILSVTKPEISAVWSKVKLDTIYFLKGNEEGENE